MKVKIIISCLIMLMSFNNSFGSNIDDRSGQKVDLEASIRPRIFKLLCESDPYYKKCAPELFGQSPMLYQGVPYLYYDHNMELFTIYEPGVLEDIVEGDIANSYNMYVFKLINAAPYILLTNHGKIEIIMIEGQEYKAVVKAIFQYFKDNPNVDSRLENLYIQEITKMYIGPKELYDEKDRWYKWYDSYVN